MESRSINFYKGIAMLMVIATHAGAGSFPGYAGRIGANGARGVQLFFIISSYLAIASFSRRAESNNVNFKGALQWLANKYKRILPLYAVSILLYLLILGNGKRYWLGSVQEVSVFNILSHVFMVNGFNPYYINSILGIEWYLADLFIFYVMTPIIYKWITSLKTAVIWLVASDIISVLLTGFLGTFCPIQDGYIWETYINNFAFFCQFPVWILGIVLYYFMKEYGNKTVHNRMYVIYLGMAFILAILLIKGAEGEIVSPYLWWGIMFGLIIIGEKRAKKSFARNSVIEYIGKISYPIYLFHYLVIHLWEKYINSPEITSMGFAVKYICVTAASILISHLIMRIENRETLHRY